MKSGIAAVVVCIAVLAVPMKGKGQRFINGYTDYQVLEDSLMEKIQAAGNVQLFTSIPQLRYRAQLLPDTAIARLLPVRPARKKLSVSKMLAARKPSVLMIAKYMAGDSIHKATALPWASAIVLSADGICASNYHVFFDMLSKRVFPDKKDSLLFAVDYEGNLFSIDSILSYNQKADAVLFKINPRNKELVPMPVAEKDPEVGDRVHTLTHPKGYLFNYTAGVVSRKSAVAEEGIWGNRLEITADFARGSSGGPVMDDKGNLVAMISATNSVYSRDIPSQGNLQMVVKKTIPVSLLIKLAGK